MLQKNCLVLEVRTQKNCQFLTLQANKLRNYKANNVRVGAFLDGFVTRMVSQDFGYIFYDIISANRAFQWQHSSHTLREW